MATTNKTVDLASDPAKLNSDFTKGSNYVPLPPEMLSDLRDSFEFFARGGHYISRTDMESIIYNFGFKVLNSREKDAELKKADSQFNTRTGFDFEFLERDVNHRWYKAIP